VIIESLPSSSQSVERPPPKLPLPEGENKPPTGEVDVGFAAFLDRAETLRESGEEGGRFVERGVERESKAFKEIDFGEKVREEEIGGRKESARFDQPSSRISALILSLQRRYSATTSPSNKLSLIPPVSASFNAAS
jgi:hypothetical protein